MHREPIRTETYQPLINGKTYTLHLYETNLHNGNKDIVRYEFLEDENMLFEGEDFCCSPLHAIDSDEAIRSLLTFLTLRLGDTDREYFDNYTEDQMKFAQSYECEALQCECYE